MGFSRQWSGLSLHSSRGSSLPRDRTCVFYVYLHWQVGSLPVVSPRKPSLWLWNPFMEGLAGLCTPAARIALICTGPHLSTAEALFFPNYYHLPFEKLCFLFNGINLTPISVILVIHGAEPQAMADCQVLTCENDPFLSIVLIIPPELWTNRSKFRVMLQTCHRKVQHGYWYSRSSWKARWW